MAASRIFHSVAALVDLARVEVQRLLSHRNFREPCQGVQRTAAVARPRLAITKRPSFSLVN
jgi:hypothetical protein